MSNCIAFVARKVKHEKAGRMNAAKADVANTSLATLTAVEGRRGVASGGLQDAAAELC